MREGVQPGAEQHILGYAGGGCAREQVLGVAAAYNQVGAKSNRVGARLVGGIASRGAMQLLRIGTEDGNGERVIEDERSIIEELVRGTPQGDPQGSS